MKKTLILFILSLGFVTNSHAVTWSPEDRLLDAFCQIESSGGQFVYGDGGRSLGPFQIQKAAWTDVSAWRKKRSLPTYDYEGNVLNPTINRRYAADYITILYGQLYQKYQRQPTPSEIYAAYNMGMSNFRKCNYDISRVNSVTAKKCRELEISLK